MKTLQDYIDKLNSLHFKEMYENDFFLTWEKTDEELEAVFTLADALRFMRENNISTKVFESGLGISIFRDNSTRTRFSFAAACNMLGLQVQDLDEGKSQIAHGETVRETANMVSFMADAIGIRVELLGTGIPSSIISMLPYVLALVVLTISSVSTKLRQDGRFHLRPLSVGSHNLS